jgi:hypothetical protein
MSEITPPVALNPEKPLWLQHVIEDLDSPDEHTAFIARAWLRLVIKRQTQDRVRHAMTVQTASSFIPTGEIR